MDDRGPVHMFSVHNPGKMFSEHVLGTRAFILRALWNVLGTHLFKVENGTHLGLRSMTYCVYTAQRVRSFWCALSVLIAVCVLSPAHLEHCSRYTSVHTCFGCVLMGRFVPRTWFDHVPAGTVLAETILFRTRSDYKKWCVPRTCSRWNCTENKYERPVWCQFSGKSLNSGPGNLFSGHMFQFFVHKLTI